MRKEPSQDVVSQFDALPDSALLTIKNAGLILSRSVCSIHRHFIAGDLTRVKIGGSTRVRVSELRALIGLTSKVQA